MDRFPGFRSCWSGDAASLAAEPASIRRQTMEAETLTKEKSTTKTTHWEPKLQAISEDCSTADVNFSRQITETDKKKRPVKVKSKSTATAIRPPSCHRKDYRNSCQKITLPALSPAPFYF